MNNEKVEGELILTNEEEAMEGIGISPCDFAVTIKIDDNKPIKKQLENKEKINKILEEELEAYSYYENNEYQEDKEIIENLKEDLDNFLDSIKFIKFDSSSIDINEVLEKNTDLLEKNIVLNDYLTITDYDKAHKLLEEYKNYKENIYVYLEGNSLYTKLEDCVNTIDKIKEKAEEIKAKNLSPFETIMYTYDQVRNRVYKMEKENEDPSVSRDLTDVLQGDNIVCVGYANIFNALLHYMGFNSNNVRVFRITDNEQMVGHQRNMAYIKDDKYDLDGVYFFDATWDSKRKNQTNEFLNSYKYFAKTKDEMEQLENTYFEYEGLCACRKDLSEVVKDLLDQDDLYTLNMTYAQSINYMGRMLGEKRIIDRLTLIPNAPSYNKFDRDKLIKNLKALTYKYNKPISAENYLDALLNVRKLEYYENSDLYPYTINNIYETYIRSNWKFDERHYNAKDRLLYAIFNEVPIERDDVLEDFRTYLGERDKAKEVETVKLAKVLRKTLDKKTNKKNN